MTRDYVGHGGGIPLTAVAQVLAWVVQGLKINQIARRIRSRARANPSIMNEYTFLLREAIMTMANDMDGWARIIRELSETHQIKAELIRRIIYHTSNRDESRKSLGQDRKSVLETADKAQMIMTVVSPWPLRFSYARLMFLAFSNRHYQSTQRIAVIRAMTQDPALWIRAIRLMEIPPLEQGEAIKALTDDLLTTAMMVERLARSPYEQACMIDGIVLTDTEDAWRRVQIIKAMDLDRAALVALLYWQVGALSRSCECKDSTLRWLVKELCPDNTRAAAELTDAVEAVKADGHDIPF